MPSLADGIDDDTKLTWDFSLPPHLDQERIIVNGAQLGRILSVGAFRSLHINEYQGKTTQVTPEINGITASGEATAGLKVHVDRAELQQHGMMDDFGGIDGSFVMRFSGKTRVIAKLNKPEIASRVVDDKRDKGLSSEEAWARQLNTAVNKSIRATAKKHLAGREENRAMSMFGRLYYPFVMAGTTLNIADHGMSTMPLTFVAGSVVCIAVQEYANRMVTGESTLEHRRWSLTSFTPEQLDRYAAVQALTRVVPLIRAKK